MRRKQAQQNGHSERPTEELKNFTNREREKALFRTHVNAAEDTPLPLVMFYGVGGSGKTWLTRRLNELLAFAPNEQHPIVFNGEKAVSSARLDMDTSIGGGSYLTDSAIAYAQIRQQMSVECPTFDLAYAMLRFKQNAGEEPIFKQGGAMHNAWEVIVEAMTGVAGTVAGSVLAVSAGVTGPAEIAAAGAAAGQVVRLAAQKVKRLGKRTVENSPQFKQVLSQSGNEDLLKLRRMSVEMLYDELPKRLGNDLDEHLPERPGKACRGVIFIDTFEAIQTSVARTDQQNEREQWIVKLYENLSRVLIVVAGRDRLCWGEHDADWNDPANLVQHEVGGLSAGDAGTFLGWCGVTDSRLQEAVLRVCVDTDAAAQADSETTFHAGSLALCVDTIAQERRRGVETDPATFDMAPGDYDALARRFLRSLASDARVRWVTQLALPPRFDEDAARTAFSPHRGPAQYEEWHRLRACSFVSGPDKDGWYTLHKKMRDALRRRMETPANATERTELHQWWWVCWLTRSLNVMSDYAALAWYHEWCLKPAEALEHWAKLAELTKRKQDHDVVILSILVDWWLPTDVENKQPHDVLEVSVLQALGACLLETSLGNRVNNLQRAIADLHKALHDHTVDIPPGLQVAIHNSLGGCYTEMPIGDRDKNLRTAIACYEIALPLCVDNFLLESWAMTQINMGNAYAQLHSGDVGDNKRQAITCYKAASRFFEKTTMPLDWAMTQHNLGNAHRDLPTGDRNKNLLRRIVYYRRALLIRTESRHRADWAETQLGLGDVFIRLSSGDVGDNLNYAIECFESALSVFKKDVFPHKWAQTQLSLGLAYGRLSTDIPINKADHLARAVAHFRATLLVHTEEDYPLDWAWTQRNLAASLLLQDNLDEAYLAVHCAVRGYTATGQDKGAQEADGFARRIHIKIMLKQLGLEDALPP